MKKTISLKGDFSLPGDKSITHRAVMFGSIAEGKTEILTTILGRDNFATIRIMRQLGAEIRGEVTQSLKDIAVEEGLADFKVCQGKESKIVIEGKGAESLRAANSELNCGNSGTTARLLTGLLAGRKFKSALTGDHSLVKRPFKRVSEPLSQMGAKFSKELLPFELEGGDLTGIDYTSKQASAQVKSAIILAGLQATGAVSVTEPRLSRDHTERMLSAMG
nr:hypothetical protein [Pseudomonadota bacterium]